MKFHIHGFNQIEVAKINKELGLDVKLKREPNWKPNTDNIELSNGNTRKRADVKLPKIGNDELLILRWFIDFYATGKMTKFIIDDIQYVSVFYKKILEDLPILDLTKDSIKRIFDNLVDFKILNHITIKNELGTFAGYSIGENYNRLVENIEKEDKEGYVKNNERVR